MLYVALTFADEVDSAEDDKFHTDQCHAGIQKVLSVLCSLRCKEADIDQLVQDYIEDA